jgi:hypothetical protein
MDPEELEQTSQSGPNQFHIFGGNKALINLSQNQTVS